MEYEIIGPKRFIAGAVCPQCKAADKTVTYAIKRFVDIAEGGQREVLDEVMSCVSCSFEQLKGDLPVVSKTDASKKNQLDQLDVMPLRIVDAAKGPKKGGD
ncbi:MAG: YheV family putative metal-binding protein [Gammaproteobacteria bacterium]|nr:YheV family putative metal-binding protein [Gammaproteobacteria bacterium]